MALTAAIEQARQRGATADARLKQTIAERRITEVIKVSGIADEYDRADRKGDLRIETAFARLYHAATTERMRELIVDAYVAWQADEKAESAAVHSGVESAVVYMKNGNPLFIDGAFVPEDSAGAA